MPYSFCWQLAIRAIAAASKGHSSMTFQNVANGVEPYAKLSSEYVGSHGAVSGSIPGVDELASRRTSLASVARASTSRSCSRSLRTTSANDFRSAPAATSLRSSVGSMASGSVLVDAAFADVRSTSMDAVVSSPGTSGIRSVSDPASSAFSTASANRAWSDSSARSPPSFASPSRVSTRASSAMRLSSVSASMVSLSLPLSAREIMRSFFTAAEFASLLDGDVWWDANCAPQALARSFTTTASDCRRSMTAATSPTSFVTAFFASEPAMASMFPWGGSVRPVVRSCGQSSWRPPQSASDDVNLIGLSTPTEHGDGSVDRCRPPSRTPARSSRHAAVSRRRPDRATASARA